MTSGEFEAASLSHGINLPNMLKNLPNNMY